MNYIHFGTSRLSADNWAADVRYDIVVETIEGNHGLLCEDYGARIELTPEIGSSEVAEFKSITVFPCVIEEFLDSLCRNTVTPLTAQDVLEDFFAKLD